MKQSLRFVSGLLLALLPFALFGTIYGLLGLYPNYRFNPVDVENLYGHELQWFGIADGGARLIPGAYFMHHHWPVADLLSGLFYLCWIPVPMAFAIYLFVCRRYGWCARFAWAFLVVNLLGFLGYYVHPAAPPWYVLEHGFDVVFDTLGSAAGLVRFDALTGGSFFHDFYCHNANVFAAIPSLHAAYVLVAALYSVMSKCPRWISVAMFVIAAGIWFSAIYTGHHYVIDVLAGIVTALLGVFIFECGIVHSRRGRTAIKRYARWMRW